MAIRVICGTLPMRALEARSNEVWEMLCKPHAQPWVARLPSPIDPAIFAIPTPYVVLPENPPLCSKGDVLVITSRASPVAVIEMIWIHVLLPQLHIDFDPDSVIHPAP